MEVLSEQTCLKELAKLFDANEMPLRTVESETFKNFIKLVNPDFIIPSRRLLARECLKLKLSRGSSGSPQIYSPRSPRTVFEF
jgi:hypothetical protein